MLRATGFLVILVAVATVAAPAAGAATKAGYIQSADRVCRKYDSRLAAVPQPPTGSPLAHHKAYAAWGDRVRSVFKSYDQALGALSTPASAKGFVAAWHKVKRTAEAYVAKFVDDGVFANFEPQAKSLVRANKRFGAVAAEYGFANCGRRYRSGHLPHRAG